MKTNFGKILSFLLITIMMLSFLSACSAPAEETTSEEPAAEESVAEETTSEEAEAAEVAEDEKLEMVYAATQYSYYHQPRNWLEPLLSACGLTLEHLIDDALLGGFKPALATDWSVDESGTVWTFNIRDGVTFHDGTVCDANAIAWSLEFHHRSRTAHYVILRGR